MFHTVLTMVTVGVAKKKEKKPCMISYFSFVEHNTY